MSSGGRSAEQQAVVEHNVEGQHLLGQRVALLKELRDESGKDIKWPLPACVNPAPTTDENLTPNSQLSVLEQSPRPCRREQHQPVELVIVVNADDEGKLALEEQVASLQRKLDDSLRCKVAKQLRAQLAEARAEIETHEAQRVEFSVLAATAAKATEQLHKATEQLHKATGQLHETGTALVGMSEARADKEAKLAESEAAVEVQRSRALASEEQVASLQGELDDSLQLLAEAHHSRCGLLKSMQAALVVTSEQLARAKANAQVTAAHFRQDRMLRAACLACTFAALLHNLYVTWIVHDVKADHVALKADFVSYYEDCLDIAAKEMAPVYQNCQDVLATCESVQRNVWSHFSAQVAFAAWLRGLGLD